MAGLRSLLGFGAPLQRRSRLDPGLLPDDGKASRFSFWRGAQAIAAEAPASNLNQMLPDKKDLQSYLDQVRNLLVDLSDKLAAKC